MKSTTILTTLLMLLASVPGWAAGQTYSSIPTQEKVIALTFDDGPLNPYTSEILDILKKHNVKGTFFVVGENAKENPAMLKRIMDEGHEIGNHTWNHPMIKFKSADYIRKQIENTDQVIRDAGYKGTIHFRAPYGVRTKVLPTVLADMGKDHILWSVDTIDWRRPSSDKIAKRILKQAHPGSIVLMHDGGGKRQNTVNALDTVIVGLKEKGYSFVTVQELINTRQAKAAEEPKAQEPITQETRQQAAQ